jgi:hypothetical protein
VVHASHLSYLGSEDKIDESLRPDQAKSYQDPISVNNLVWWHVPVIPAVKETYVRKSRSRQPGQKCEILFEK